MRARGGLQVVFVALVMLSLSGCALLGLVPTITVYQGSTKITDGGTFNFMSMPVGISTIPVDFTIKNTGSVALDLKSSSAIAVSGTDADDFVLQPGAAKEVGPGSSGDFALVFSPTTDGARTATVKVTGSDGTTFSITLTGYAPSVE